MRRERRTQSHRFGRALLTIARAVLVAIIIVGMYNYIQAEI